MPHYITKLDDRHPARFAVYSTIVDNLVTVPMTAPAMRRWLEGNGYDTWLTPYDAEQVIADWYADSSEGMKRLMREQGQWMYWHKGSGFCYVLLSDAYFVLPRSEWRNE